MNPEAKETPEYGPNTEAFLTNPNMVVDQIRQALKAGLAPEFVEQHLEPILREARNVNKVNKKQQMAETTRKIDSLRNALITQLKLIDAMNHEEIKQTVKRFCEERNLDIKPVKNHAVNINTDMTPDWTSDDGQIGLQITPDSVWIYQNLNGRWMPTFLKDI
jgi:hypothetical protein